MSTGIVLDRSTVNSTGRLPHPAGRALRPAPFPRLRLVPTPVEIDEEAAGPGTTALVDPLRSLLPAVASAPVLRLTPRGRAIAVLVLLVGIFCLGMAFGSAANGADSVPAPVEHSNVVVQPGQTLWGIARSLAPATDPRVTIEAIRDLNALPTAEIQAGQALLLP